MTPDGHQMMRLTTDETSAVRQAGRQSKASVDDDRSVKKAALATMGFTAKEASDRRWAEFAENGPIGFRSGTDPEVKPEAERGVSVSHESRETINQTKPRQSVLAHNQESHNYKPNNCKQIKRNSFEPAESHRLFTVENKEKTRRLLSRGIEGTDKLSSNVSEREQINLTKAVVKVPSMVGRIPTKIIGTDIEGNILELSFHIGGDPMLTNRTQINPIKPKTTQNHVKPPKTTQNHITPHKTTQNPVKPHPSKVGVLTDRPPGTPSTIAQDQDVVNTVGPVPMTFGYGPNTFPHSAAHVLNNNHSPSICEGDQNHNLKAYKYETKTSHFTGSTFNVVPNSNKDETKILLFTQFRISD